jgi:hypothetical protein
MKRSSIIFSLLLLISLATVVAAQTAETKRYDQEGLTFDYPSAWKLQDVSKPDRQHLTLMHETTGVQIMVLVSREAISKPEQLAAARKAVVDPLVENMAQQFKQMGLTPERSTVTTEIGGAQAEGIRLRAVLDGAPGNADTYSLLLGQRLVVISTFGGEAEFKQIAAGWDTIRRSVKVEVKAPAPKANK